MATKSATKRKPAAAKSTAAAIKTKPEYDFETVKIEQRKDGITFGRHHICDFEPTRKTQCHEPAAASRYG
jgi:hypothetical protein